MLNNFFLSHVNHDFSILIDGVVTKLVLKNATEHKSRIVDGSPFSPLSVLFLLENHVVISQGVYIIFGPDDFEMPLFIVPVGETNEGVLYESVFN